MGLRFRIWAPSCRSVLLLLNISITSMDILWLWPNHWNLLNFQLVTFLYFPLSSSTLPTPFIVWKPSLNLPARQMECLLSHLTFKASPNLMLSLTVSSDKLMSKISVLAKQDTKEPPKNWDFPSFLACFLSLQEALLWFCPRTSSRAHSELGY